MRITADTNVLVRGVGVVGDDPAQAAAAARALRNAERIAVPLPALSEFVWVLRAQDAIRSSLGPSGSIHHR